MAAIVDAAAACGSVERVSAGGVHCGDKEPRSSTGVHQHRAPMNPRQRHMSTEDTGAADITLRADRYCLYALPHSAAVGACLSSRTLWYCRDAGSPD